MCSLWGVVQGLHAAQSMTGLSLQVQVQVPGSKAHALFTTIHHTLQNVLVQVPTHHHLICKQTLPLDILSMSRGHRQDLCIMYMHKRYLIEQTR